MAQSAAPPSASSPFLSLNANLSCAWFPQRWRTPARRWPAATEAPASSRQTACRQSACAPSGASAKPSRRCAAATGRTTATSVSSTSTPARTRRTYECSTRAAAVSYTRTRWQWAVSSISTAIDSISIGLTGKMQLLFQFFLKISLQSVWTFFFWLSLRTSLLILVLLPLCFVSHEHRCQLLFLLSRSSEFLFSSGTDSLCSSQLSSGNTCLLSRHSTLRALFWVFVFLFFWRRERPRGTNPISLCSQPPGDMDWWKDER